DWPEQLERYEVLYVDRAYLPRAETAAIDGALVELKGEWSTVGRRPSFTTRPGGSKRMELEVASQLSGPGRAPAEQP
ncbi:MAG: hypothetical protein LC744_06240, partial [Chloroflexi bacterium]|nr:hypothetical protein [Chloroflexota bacterium]